MVVALLPKEFWSRAIEFLWFERPNRLRQLQAIQQSFEAILEYTGYHAMTQQLAFLHRITHSLKTQNFSVERLTKAPKKARPSLDVPIAIHESFRFQRTAIEQRVHAPHRKLQDRRRHHGRLSSPNTHRTFAQCIDDVAVAYSDIWAHVKAMEHLRELDEPSSSQAFDRTAITFDAEIQAEARQNT